MEPLATPAELRSFLQDDNIPESLAALALETVSGLIRDWCNISFDYVEDDVVTLDGTGSEALMLPEVPVSFVTEVLENGVLLDSSLYEWNEDGILRRPNRWRKLFRYYQVTYDHGYEVTPSTVRGVCLRSAARGIVNPAGVSAETIGRYTAQYGFDASRLMTLADPDKNDLAGYRIEGRPKGVGVARAGS